MQPTGTVIGEIRERHARRKAFTSWISVAILAFFMDKFWSVCAMPIGLFLCFTPIVIAWVLAESKSSGKSGDKGR